jgi:hypothetical protein
MAWITDISLDIKINENARIDRIHLRDGVDLFSDRPVNYIDTHVKGGYSLTDVERGHKLSGGVAMSIHVAFLTGTPRGRVEFRSAGITVGFKLSN